MIMFLEIVLGVITANAIMAVGMILALRSAKVRQWYIKMSVKLAELMMKSME